MRGNSENRRKCRKFKVGKKTIESQVVCGKSYPCTHGEYNLCENLKVMGFQTLGTSK